MISAPGLPVWLVFFFSGPAYDSHAFYPFATGKVDELGDFCGKVGHLFSCKVATLI